MSKARVQPGVPAGGEFTTTLHGESSVALGAPVSAPQNPGLHGPMPAPLASQKYLDGTRIPEGLSFGEAYDEFFRPLEDYEAVHGPWVNTRPPSEDQLRDLAGLTGVNLGRTTGFFVEADETTGDPVIAVTTRNGNSQARDCIADSDFDCMTCKHCIQEHLIPALPTHIRDEDDSDGDAYVTSYFEPLDPAAATRYLADQKTRELLNHRTWAREAITSGKQPPWAILTPARDRKERRVLGVDLSYARLLASRNSGDERYANDLMAAVDTGTPMPDGLRSRGAMIDTAGYSIYGEAVPKHRSEAARLRQVAAALDAERQHPLPPAVSALAAAEADRLAKAAAHEDDQASHSLAHLEKSKNSIRHWATRRLQEAAKLNAAVSRAEAELKAFDWSNSWPGDPADCPPPAAG